MAEAQYEIEEDEKSVDVDVSETEETEIELKSSQKEDTEESNTSFDEDDEHQEYSAGVKKRIDRLTKKMREAERQREEAVKYAQNVQSEAEKIRTRMQALDQGYMTEYGSRLSMEQQQVESELKRAVEMGDSDATVAAQRKMTQLAVASDRYETTKQAQERSLKEQQQAAKYQEQQPAPQQAPRAPDPKAEDWASKNEWFGSDEAMTFAAFGLHKRLVEDEGFDPTSNEYYSELDNRIRKEFPHKFKDSAGKRPVQNVAGSARGTTGRTGRNTKVKLTPSQVAIAKKLGVPLEEYAKYVK
jgi:hypothetical protein